MSLFPYFFDEFRPRRLWDQNFGVALTPDDVLTITRPLASKYYFRPWSHLAAAARDVGSSIKVEKDKFQINLDVQHFSPEDVTVKVADGYIVIEANHEEKKDEHGYISRHFVRKYALPEDTLADNVESKLSSDGVLTVIAPRKTSEVKGERKVPITQTGPVRKEIKEQYEETDTKEEDMDK